MAVLTISKPADSYFELVREFPLRRIKTAGAYHKAMALVLRLSHEKTDQGIREYLDVLVDLVADYETKRCSLEGMHITAADLVRHRIEEMGSSISDVARKISVPQSNLSEMLNGKRGWSKAAIRELSKLFHIRAERFLE